MVRSPVSRYDPSFAASTAVERNVAVGWRSVWKKSSLRRCSSRPGSPLATLPTSMVATTDDSSGFSAIVTSPLTSGKWPRTLVTMRWRALNDTSVCVASRAQVPGWGASGTEGTDCATAMVHSSGREHDSCARNDPEHGNLRVYCVRKNFRSGGTIRDMAERAPRWLSEPEMRSWRVLIDVTTGVLATLDGELRAEHGLSLG